MIKKIELLYQIAELENRVTWLEGRIDKLEQAKKVRKVKKDEGKK